MATYFTTANIVMSHVLTMSDPPQAALNILSFAPVGGLVAAAGIAYLTIYGYRMVPARRPAPEQLLARRTSDELEGLFEVGERLWEARIDEISPLIGRSLQASSLGEKLGIAVCALRRGYQAYFAPRSEEIIRAHDVLLIVGREDRVMQLGSLGALVKPQTHSITNFGLTLIELILAPHSAYVGRTIKELDFRRRFGFTVLAIQRGARSHRTDVGTIALQRGDALLIAGLASGARSLQADPEVIVFEADPASRPVSRGRAALSISIFVGAVVLSLLGLPIFLAVLTAALLAVLGGFVALRDAYRSIEWEILIFLAGMYAASLAMVNTGLAAFMSRAVLDSLGGVSAIGLAAAAFLVAASLTQVMGGQATAFIVGPIAVSSAIELHVNPQAIAVAAAIGCGAAFLTPLAHPVNLIMMGPGNYRFGDFARSGAALMLVVFVALLAGLAWFWGL
jgi:di/tricarboxylate transporter